jgi:ABC-type branched-subunit amino acid transport system substrate-binding protein
LALVLAACQTWPGTGTKPQVGEPTPIPGQPGSVPQFMAGRTPVRVALLLPLGANNSDLKQIAQALLESAELAVFEVGNADLLLSPKDTRGTAAGAEAAVRQALSEGAELILGPLLRDEVTAIAPIARQHNVPVLAFSTDRSVAGNGVFLLSFQPEQEIDRVTNYAVLQARFNFAALIPNTDYGLRVRDAFIASVGTNGGQVIALQPYERNPAAMMDPVRSLANYEKQTLKLRSGAAASGTTGAIPGPPPPDPGTLDRLLNYQSYASTPFDAVLLPEGGTLLRALAPLLPYYDVDPHQVKFLGTGLWDDPVIGREPALVGGWFAAPPPDARKAFLGRFQSAYGKVPPRIVSIAFDAVALAGALGRLPKSQRFALSTLSNPNGFSGIDGIFRFRPDGSSERGLAILEVTPNGFVVVSPAPATFETPKGF